jgi:hypothetical protein
MDSYAEAHKIKLKADALEAWELEKWHCDRQQVDNVHLKYFKCVFKVMYILQIVVDIARCLHQ